MTPIAPPRDPVVWKAAQDYAAVAIGQLLQPMFDTVGGPDTMFGGGDGERTWMPMLVTEMGKKIAGAGGLGLAAPIYDQMLRAQEQRTGATR